MPRNFLISTAIKQSGYLSSIFKLYMYPQLPIIKLLKKSEKIGNNKIKKESLSSYEEKLSLKNTQFLCNPESIVTKEKIKNNFIFSVRSGRKSEKTEKTRKI